MPLVLIEVEGGVASVILNRPEEQNALNVELSAELAAALAAVAHDPAVRCVVLRGSGGRFSVGGDLNMLSNLVGKPEAERRLTPRRVLDGLHQAVITIRTMRKPVVSAIQGAIAGGAVYVALACDFVIAEEGTRLVYAYDVLGISPDAGGTYFWPRLIGERAAMELALFGGSMTAEEALAKGAINRVVPKAKLAEEVASVANRLAEGPTLAYGKVKRLIYGSMQNGLADQLEAEALDVSDCLVSEDFTGALGAFAERRPPKFEGR